MENILILQRRCFINHFDLRLSFENSYEDSRSIILSTHKEFRQVLMVNEALRQFCFHAALSLHRSRADCGDSFQVNPDAHHILRIGGIQHNIKATIDRFNN